MGPLKKLNALYEGPFKITRGDLRCSVSPGTPAYMKRHCAFHAVDLTQSDQFPIRAARVGPGNHLERREEQIAGVQPGTALTGRKRHLQILQYKGTLRKGMLNSVRTHHSLQDWTEIIRVC
jgi:hypothetical protein